MRRKNVSEKRRGANAEHSIEDEEDEKWSGVVEKLLASKPMTLPWYPPTSRRRLSICVPIHNHLAPLSAAAVAGRPEELKTVRLDDGGQTGSGGSARHY